MKLSDMKPGDKMYTVLAFQVLAVLSRRYDGYAVYIGTVPGKNYDIEWWIVADEGDKTDEVLAETIVKSRFHLEVDLPYAH